ncbi:MULTISPECIES: GNAT family N-acetyltransferase [unclassified Ensifer]|uniref:GNAT family N-acetyltransferase n=1 Tax=unclassified Ensifer TaxID=2633371 RepID=UPI0008133035|nr:MULTISPECIES: GNAT family N-acetyltransferase [unclassified Ensifer]OCP01797.1 acetyltransferase [Ensifer sp. LC14]OCP09586.1 acetyltransferase [Ensifer sp. LC13]OCP10758.1 acetyltransferase [Ensifer sp. LC11]OCP32833.1 acetyltransferase [Ensifer sp. LC499]
MRIRLAASNDHAALSAIDTVAATDPKRSEEIAGWIEAGCCHLAEVDGAVAAYGVLTHHFFGHAFIEMLMVSASHRRRGLGAALIEHFQSLSSGSKLFSSTNMSNRPMQELLIQTGFKPSGYIDNLDENDPEIVFFSAPRPTEA